MSYRVFGTDRIIPDFIDQKKYYKIYDLLDTDLPISVKVDYVIMYYKIRKLLKRSKK